MAGKRGAGRLWRAVAGAVLLAALPLGAAVADGLSAQELRGREIYHHGRSLAGAALWAYVGLESVKLPAHALPCAGCHGPDGEGRPEGGVLPSNITWTALTKPYGDIRPDGRSHPAYTEAHVAAAVTRGIDPAGNRLNPAMPRYAMPADAVEDLIAYLKRLETDLDPGVTETTVRIGALLPGSGRFGGVEAMALDALTAHAREANERGGIHGRAIEIVAGQAGADPSATLAEARRLIEEEQVFALIGAFLGEAMPQVAALAAEEQVPLMMPIAPPAADWGVANNSTFFLLPGLDVEARTLVEGARARIGADARIAVIHAPWIDGRITDALRPAAAADGGEGPVVAVAEYGGPEGTAALVRRLAADDVDAVLFLGSSRDLPALMKEVAGLGWDPAVLLPGSLIGPDVFQAADPSRRILVAVPILPPGHPAAHRANGPAARPAILHPSQMVAHAAAEVLAEGLRRTGRALRREALIGNLEELDRFDTGLSSPVSYGPNRRVGVMGAYVGTLDLDTQRLSDDAAWIDLD